MSPNPNLDNLLTHETPFDAFAAWFEAAASAEPHNPDAAQLATIDVGGMPNVRTVLVRHRGPEGFVFFTHLDSAKGRELEGHPQAALLFYWKQLNRQVRLRGVVSQVDDGVADRYFANRPRESQLSAHASAQSRPLSNPAIFENAVDATRDTFEGREIPRPPRWSGFRLIPSSVEFWQEGPHRRHQRVRFERDVNGWRAERLYP